MRQFVKPPPLKKGGLVGIIAPSDAVERRFVLKGTQIIESWGLKAKLGRHLFAKVGDFSAGTATERQADLLQMIYDPRVNLIWAATGGYAATEVLPIFKKELIDHLKLNPKWFIGYSDACVLLNALFSFGIMTLHGPNLAGLNEWNEKTHHWLKRLLFNEIDLVMGSELNWQPLIPGQAEGRLLVSNLDSLMVTLGTRFDPLMHGQADLVLALEEWWGEKSTIQRQLDTILNHKRNYRIKALILGRFVGIGEQAYPRWGRRVTVEALTEARVRARGGLPLVVLSEFGHLQAGEPLANKLMGKQSTRTFLTLPNGFWARLNVDAASAHLTLSAGPGR